MQEDLPCGFARLSVTSPKELRLDGNVTTRSIAAAFYQGLIDCDNPSRTAPLSAYLQAEGPRRVPAFVFERLFIQRMKSNHEVSDNWYVCGAHDKKAPSIWFKLMSPASGWSALDNAFTRSLISHRVPVWKAWFEGRRLLLSTAGQKTTVITAAEFLANNPCDMNIKRGQVRGMYSKGKVQQNALHMLEAQGEVEVDELIRSRIFINCFLELTGGRPFDVDAICRRDGQIFATEFKRKYPTQEGFFGVDLHLTKLPRLLDGICPLYHFVMEDMRGKSAKNNDPTVGLAAAHNERPDFRWHLLRLVPGFEKIYTKRLSTNGTDSGQRGGRRTQVGIPVSAFTRLPALGAFDVPGS